MTIQDIAFRRLFSQRIGDGHFIDPVGLVKWMGCIRAEDFPGAMWSIGLRVQGSTENSVEKAFNEGHILRTHVLTPAWRLVAAEDIGWLLALTAPRIKAFNSSLYRALGMDEALLRKGRGILTRGLRDGELTQTQLMTLIRREKFPIDEVRLNLLLMDAGLDGLICSGSMDGRQFTYTLMDRRAPARQRCDKASALAELTGRYFRSRGPATEKDFLLWSGLRPSEVRIGIDMNRHWLAGDTLLGETYWFDPVPVSPPVQSLHLLPAFDEMATAYVSKGVFKPAVIIDGQVAGTWTKKVGGIDVQIPGQTDTWVKEAITRAEQQYRRFHGQL